MTAPAIGDSPFGLNPVGARAGGDRRSGPLKVSVIGIGLLGPALNGWASAQPMLLDAAGYTAQATVVPAPQRLPATERRRAGTVVKAAITVADEALAAAGVAAGTLPTVFTSSTGDPLNCHLLCEALASAERLVSPTRFTNSVHNAPAGYWHIATQSMAPSTSLAAYDASFAEGLVEAAVQCVDSGAAVLLVACDVPYPEPLHTLRPLSDTFGVALVLAPPGQGRGLEILDPTTAVPTACSAAALDAVRRTIPAARSLPLLQALAADAGAQLVIEGLSGQAQRLKVLAR
jgi:hypothetical protein